MKNQIFLLVLLVFGIFGCQTEEQSEALTLTSPDGSLSLNVFLTPSGHPAFTLQKNGSLVLDTSRIGGFDFQGQPALGDNMQIIDQLVSTFSETWDMPWGEQLTVENTYNELYLDLEEVSDPKRSFSIVFKLFDDGLGFRYSFPVQDAMPNEVVIMDEHTHFALTGDHTTWWIPGDWDIYEHLYNTTPFSEIDAISKRNHPNLAQTFIPENAVNTPVTMRTSEGLHLSFHEAALYDYSGMTLKVDRDKMEWVSELVGKPDSSKVKVDLPFSTPWRTVQVAEKATDLIDSKIILNLNPDNQMDDISWFKPTKYMGIWWEMHLGKSSWDMASGKHGANTENAKRYIDFCAENNIGALLVEGWNTGWERWIGFPDREGVFDFVTPYPDYDIEEVVRYGKEKGVDIIMHHETSAAPRTYDQQLEAAYQL